MTPLAIREEEPRGSCCKGGTFVMEVYKKTYTKSNNMFTLLLDQ